MTTFWAKSYLASTAHQSNGSGRIMKTKGGRSYFIDPKMCPKIRQMEGLETTILTGLRGEKMMMVLNATLPGHSVPTHAHPNEQVGVVYGGKARLKIGDDERIVEKGDFYCIPANVSHSDVNIGKEPFVMLDIFYPVREEFIRKAKTQQKCDSGS
jgi:quercetin dioxygenase-like cupin family protein